ncbi:MAG TPA: hypothetical protein VGB07_14175 [Blastocatellia bacterium]
MAETVKIALADLLLDVENPRLSMPNIGQRDAQRELAKLQQRKLQILAADVVKYGMNQSDLPIVMPFDDDLRRYVVLEGNRRLVTLRALENPDSMAGAVTPTVLTALRKLSASYQENPIESINCLVVKDRAEAEHWIELRHSGEMEGAGVVRWGSDESDRFRARGRKREPHTQALDFLENRGVLTPEKRRDIPASSFKRLIDTAEVREKLGIDVRNKELVLIGNEKQVAKALMHVANDLASGNTPVKEIYHKDDRINYANNLPTSIVVTPTKKGNPIAPTVIGGQQTMPKPVASTSLPKQRDRLIPRDCTLSVTDARIRRIEAELRNLSLENYTNAVSVLFRVFIELSCDAYIVKEGLATVNMASLQLKISDVSSHLLNRKKLTTEQARPVRRATVKDSFLAPSITLMNGYVHNQHIFPAPGDLRAHWDSLQPFLAAIWSV